MFDQARLGNFAGWIDHTADGPLRPDFIPDTPAGIDRLQRLFVKNGAGIGLVEIPPGKAVDRRNHSRIRPQKRGEVIDDHRNGMRLDRQDHIILLAKVGRFVAGRQLVAAGAAVLLKTQTIFPDRRQMRPARHKADIGPGLVKRRPDIAANRAGAKNTYPCHAPVLLSLVFQTQLPGKPDSLQLAGGTLRNFVKKDDMFRDLEFGEMLLGIGA